MLSEAEALVALVLEHDIDFALLTERSEDRADVAEVELAAAFEHEGGE